jgi:hypothetical protein
VRALFELKNPVVKVNAPKDNVPPVSVVVPVVVTSLPKVIVSDTPLTIIELLSVTLLVVIVAVAVKVIVPVDDHVVVLDSVIAPAIVKAPVDVKLHVASVVVREEHERMPDKVTVGEPELPSIITASFCDGETTPPAPPEELAQLVLVDASHVPLPPTQYTVLEGMRAKETAAQGLDVLNVAVLAVDIPAATCNSSVINRPLLNTEPVALTLAVVDAFGVKE